MPCFPEEKEFMHEFLGVDHDNPPTCLEESMELIHAAPIPRCKFCDESMLMMFTNIAGGKEYIHGNLRDYKRIFVFYCKCEEYNFWVDKLNVYMINTLVDMKNAQDVYIRDNEEKDKDEKDSD